MYDSDFFLEQLEISDALVPVVGGKVGVCTGRIQFESSNKNS